MAIIKHIYCDCCGKTFYSEHNLTMHNQVSGGGAMAYLDRAFNKAKTKAEKIYAIKDHFGMTNEPIHRLSFNMDDINCAIKCAKNGLIHNEDNPYDTNERNWYKSNIELATFIEKNLKLLKEEYNKEVLYLKQETIREFERELSVFDNKLVQ